jgi:hypothetical protein
MKAVENHCVELKTAAEVRAHARTVIARIKEQRQRPKQEPPKPDEPKPEPKPIKQEIPKPKPKTYQRFIPLADIRRIYVIAADYYGIPFREMLGRNREKRVCLPRQVVFYIIRELGVSFERVGYLVGRDHSTTFYGYLIVKQRLACGDVQLAEDIKAICARITEKMQIEWPAAQTES